MTHFFFSQPASTAWTSQLPSVVISTGRFVLHFVEMWIAMLVGMAVFMVVPGVMALPAVLHQTGMALSMSLPMVAWMRIRGHGWRHGIDMTLAMLVPWAVVEGLTGLGAGSALPWLAQSGTAAMALGMLGIMLFRREHYIGGAHHNHAAAHAEPHRHRHVPWRRILLVSAYAGAILLVPPTVAGANVYHKLLDTSEPLAAPAYAGALPALPTPDPSKKIAVVLSGPLGSEIGDTLEAYEILARSGVYNVYSIAPERTVLSLQPGASIGGSSLDFVPHFSFAEYDAQIGRAPDLIAVPWFDGGYSAQRDAAELDWIRGHFGPNTTILGICVGTAIVADTGLLDGRTATGNTNWFSYVESHAPTTRWLRNVRYVDDGNIITSSNLTAGIDATLHVVDRFAGRAAALDVARQIGYTQTGALDDPTFQPPDSYLATGMTVGLEGARQQLGILLYDGVTELGQSGLIDPYTLSARTFVMAPERRIVHSRDGFLFVPRYTFSSVGTLDRVVVPAGENEAARQQVMAAWSAHQAGPPAEDIYQKVGAGETAYDVTLRDLARTHDGILARATADGLFYTANSGDFVEARWPVNEVLAQTALMLIGAAMVFAASHIRIPRRPRSVD